MNVRTLRAALTALVFTLWVALSVCHVVMVVVTGISSRGLTFGTVNLDAFALTIRFRGQIWWLGDGTANATELMIPALASLVLVVLSITLLE